MILETPRLYLRRLEQSDLQDLKEILQDPQVVYAYEHTFSDADVQHWLDRQRRRYESEGFGLWATVRKDTGEMVGQAGLTMQPYDGKQVLEVGYLLKKRFWHQGYAREAAAGCMHYAFAHLHASRVHAIIKADNTPSMAVAKALGMTKQAEFITRYYAGDMLHFLLSTTCDPLSQQSIQEVLP